MIELLTLLWHLLASAPLHRALTDQIPPSGLAAPAGPTAGFSLERGVDFSRSRQEEITMLGDPAGAPGPQPAPSFPGNSDS